ncbi:uncharacterized protein LOC141568886 isoform X2 [Rhinolophus sinicus]|uniref:uncharacterized protein LOC141568886 isoform X2 n=1 Tax=Rhinolophus sinicus TaxID=89399 RepID=UPI003D79F4D3
MGYLQGRLDGTRFCEGKWHLLWPLTRKENVSKAGLATFPCEEGILRASRSGNQAAAAEPRSRLRLCSLWRHRARLCPHPQGNDEETGICSAIRRREVSSCHTMGVPTAALSEGNRTQTGLRTQIKLSKETRGPRAGTQHPMTRCLGQQTSKKPSSPPRARVRGEPPACTPAPNPWLRAPCLLSPERSALLTYNGSSSPGPTTPPSPGASWKPHGMPVTMTTDVDGSAMWQHLSLRK